MEERSGQVGRKEDIHQPDRVQNQLRNADSRAMGMKENQQEEYVKGRQADRGKIKSSVTVP